MTALYVGLMSGTSMDAVDAVLTDLEKPSAPVLAHHKHAIPPELRATLLTLAHGENDDLHQVASADIRLGELFAAAAMELLRRSDTDPADVNAIGSHGQTVRHHPQGDAPYSWQLGDPSRIAERTGITTVSNFRGRDLAAGGQGAPLAPAFHAHAWRSPAQDRVVANIGGISNISFLPADSKQPVRGFDAGPGNVLIDGWIEAHRGEPMDRDGEWAAQGQIDDALVHALLADPYFELAPPKSTGREHFNLKWLEERMRGLADLAPETVQRSLCQLTAASIAKALSACCAESGAMYVCGGGAHNPLLMADLTALLPDWAVTSTETLGVHPDWVEALAFAWLASQTLAGLPGNMPSVTGAARPVVLGSIYPGC